MYSNNQAEELTPDSRYGGTHHGPTFDDNSHSPYCSQRQSHQMHDREEAGNTSFPGHPQRATFSHGGQFERREVSHREQQFDQQFHYTADTQRESTNSTRQITAIHTLKPSRHEMPEHSSYHGDISGPEAERILKESPKRNCYLTRYSRNSSTYTLSVVYIYNNQDKVLHLKLSIDNELLQHSLEGTLKIFATLNELLQYYENNPLSPEIRNLGSPCLPSSHLQRKKTLHSSSSQESSLSPDPNYMKEMNREMFQALTKINETHIQQLSEQRRYFDDKLDKEQEKLREIIENQRTTEQKRAEEQRKWEEQRQKDFQKLFETIGQQKGLEQQKKMEEERKAAEEKRFQELEEKMEEQRKKFEEEPRRKVCSIS